MPTSCGNTCHVMQTAFAISCTCMSCQGQLVPPGWRSFARPGRFCRPKPRPPRGCSLQAATGPRPRRTWIGLDHYRRTSNIPSHSPDLVLDVALNRLWQHLEALAERSNCMIRIRRRAHGQAAAAQSSSSLLHGPCRTSSTAVHASNLPFSPPQACWPATTLWCMLGGVCKRCTAKPTPAKGYSLSPSVRPCCCGFLAPAPSSRQPRATTHLSAPWAWAAAGDRAAASGCSCGSEGRRVVGGRPPAAHDMAYVQCV